MNRRLFVLTMSLMGAFVLLVGVLRWGDAAASHIFSPSSTPQRAGAGSGYFTDSGQRLGSGDSWGVALGDLDGDGDLDAFVGNGLYADNGQPQPNEVWLNDGRGRFTSNGQSLGNEYSGDVALADLDGDTDLDVFVINRWLDPTAPGGGQVWFNNGSGQFTDSGQTLGPQLYESPRMTVGDVDGDNDVDVFIADAGIPAYSHLWLNQGNGTFVNSGQTFGRLFDIKLADIDGDNDLDAVTPRKIFWNMGGNQGGTLGQFMDSGQLFGNATSYTVILGDLDGDSDSDALLGVGECSVCSSSVWFNNGSGVFSDSGQSVGQSVIAAMALGDLDGDGDLDAYISQPFNEAWTDHEVNGVWLNDGNGILTNSYQSLGQGYSPAIALGDLNDDGALDAFVGMYMEWDWINGQASFEAPNRVWFNKPHADLAIQQSAQVNGQTITYTLTYTNNGSDLVLGAMITDTLNPALSNVIVSSNGTVITPVVGANLAWQVAPLPAGSGGVIRVRGTFAGEIPGNVAEFAAATHDPLPQNNQATSFALFVNDITPVHNAILVTQTSPISFTLSRAILPSTLTSRTLTVYGSQTGFYEGTTNVNGNEVVWTAAAAFKPGETLTVHAHQTILSAGGTTSLLPYQQQFGAGIGVASNIGTGILTPTYAYTTTNHFNNAILGDLDGDGDLDAFLVSDFAWDPGCSCDRGLGAQVWLNNGGLQGGVPGTFTDTGQRLGTGASYEVALGDVDNDGDLDAFIANWSIWDEFDLRNEWDNGNELWLNDGTGYFTRSEQQLGYQNSYAIVLGDVDGDHDLDALVANWPGSSYEFDGRNELWLNDGQGHFTHSGQIFGDQGGADVVLGDLDGDGDLDAFVLFYENSSVWLNQGGIQGGIEGHFVATSQDWSNVNGWHLDLGDLDNDGDLDALVTDGNLPGSQVWLNNGTGIFVPGAILGNWFAQSVDLGDLDGDGDLDALIVDEDLTNTVWLNDGTAHFVLGAQNTIYSGYRPPLGDLDGDGDLDWFTASNSIVRVWLNQDDRAIVGLQAHNNSPTPIGQTTVLTATVTTGTRVVYTWDFGDGNSGSGAAAAHTYLSIGTYTATVTATNSVSTVTATTTVLVEDEAIMGVAAANDSPTPLGQTTNFTVTVTAGSNVVYTWAFGDGQIATGATVSHVYANPGVYTATVTASNSLGQLVTTTQVTIITAEYKLFMPLILKP